MSLGLGSAWEDLDPGSVVDDNAGATGVDLMPGSMGVGLEIGSSGVAREPEFAKSNLTLGWSQSLSLWGQLLSLHQWGHSVFEVYWVGPGFWFN